MGFLDEIYRIIKPVSQVVLLEFTGFYFFIFINNFTKEAIIKSDFRKYLLSCVAYLFFSILYNSLIISRLLIIFLMFSFYVFLHIHIFVIAKEIKNNDYDSNLFHIITIVII